MITNNQTKAIVSAILYKEEDGQKKIFLQTRWKPDISPMYSGMLEVPAGGIDAYENVYDALKREVKEECNLDIVEIIDDYRGPIVNPRANDKAFAFKPYLCQQVLETNNGLPWIGFVFLCKVEGTPIINPNESKDLHWATIEELSEIINKNPETIFPLQLPVLRYFIDNQK